MNLVIISLMAQCTRVVAIKAPNFSEVVRQRGGVSSQFDDALWLEVPTLKEWERVGGRT